MGGGAVVAGTLMAVDDDVDFWGGCGQAFVAGAIVGSVAGGILGAITAIFKNPKVYHNQGDPEKFREFLTIMNQ
ncbi:hypothetical protein E7Z59_07905 [Robertkochia marina]|uniref:Uncharacterized protein n=1 Tax=Robertkochia marina TaxID=1227945 RepID=A0A4V3UY33_9FLAO|nr:hypothetical protein [Robertkochia marina]THD67576.1 hypothetical protein E7Z59_07905 [Robertkochia marina]TRZ44556.1 hypothetical protein D3A96_08040 [Robertkochia marina]